MGVYKDSARSMPGLTRDLEGWKDRKGNMVVKVRTMIPRDDVYRLDPISPSAIVGFNWNPEMVRTRKREVPTRQMAEGTFVHRMIAGRDRVPDRDDLDREWSKYLEELIKSKGLRGRAAIDFRENYDFRGSQEKVGEMLKNYVKAIGKIKREFPHGEVQKERPFLAMVEMGGGEMRFCRPDGDGFLRREVPIAGIMDQQRGGVVIDLKRSRSGTTPIQLLMAGMAVDGDSFPNMAEIDLSSGKVNLIVCRSSAKDTLEAGAELIKWSEAGRKIYQPPKSDRVKPSARLGQSLMVGLVDQADPRRLQTQAGEEYSPRQVVEKAKGVFKQFLGTVKKIEI